MLKAFKIPAIWDIDTRALVRHIRKVGALRGVVATDGSPAEQLIFEAKQIRPMAGQELASRVTCGRTSAGSTNHWAGNVVGPSPPNRNRGRELT